MLDVCPPVWCLHTGLFLCLSVGRGWTCLLKLLRILHDGWMCVTTSNYCVVWFLPYTGSCCQHGCPVNDKQALQQKLEVRVGACLVRGITAEQQWDFKAFPTPRDWQYHHQATSPLPTQMRYSSLSCQALLLSAVSRASGCQRQDFISGSLRPYRKPKMFIYVSYCLAKSVCA